LDEYIVEELKNNPHIACVDVIPANIKAERQRQYEEDEKTYKKYEIVKKIIVDLGGALLCRAVVTKHLLKFGIKMLNRYVVLLDKKVLND